MRILLLIAILFYSPILNGQEVLSALVSNPVLNGKKLFVNKNKSAITLPFFDDFSYNSDVANIKKEVGKNTTSILLFIHNLVYVGF